MLDAIRREPLPGAEQTLRTIAIVFRVVGATWLITLSVLTLLTEDIRDGVDLATRDAWIAVAIWIAAVWTPVTVVVWLVRPSWLGRLVWLVPDLALSAFVAVLPALAETSTYFVGGYPISSAILWATIRGVPGGLVGGLVIAAASYRGSSASAARAAEVIAINLLSPIVVGWGFEAIRSTDRRRRDAEEELAVERARRAETVARAEMAAHLHDSVLQTLALIQRRSDDPTEVLRLARGQERELRDWLNAPTEPTGGMMAAVKEAAADIEARHGVAIDVSTVGDVALDERLTAMVSATREAMLNAAKFAGVQRVYVLAEARAHEVRIVVRDRGTGFDLAGLPDDRRGVRDSIQGRMVRNGGSAHIVSSDGGTEVDLRMAMT